MTTRVIPRSATLVAASLGLVATGCYSGLQAGFGDDASQDTETAGGRASGDDSADAELPTVPEQVGPTGLRRLTSREYDATLAELLLDDEVASNLLFPEDLRTPFDNAYGLQNPSAVLIESAELLASDAAGRLMADADRRDVIVGCVPEASDDAACFSSFVRSFGRRAFRRPLTEVEESALTDLLDLAIEKDDFYVGVESVVRTVLQSPSFLYRVEIGTPVEGDAGLFRLSGYELASRLSYFLWGTMPSDDLLDRAESGELESADGVREAAQDMLEDPRALELVATFHAMWMGYEQLPHGYDMATAMQDETRALLQRVIFDEKRPWQDVLRMDETFVNDQLAEHYGLTPPGSDEGQWVSWGDSGRKGLLSQGSFLSLGAKFGDTSPTQRGLLIRSRLFCQDIPPPPPDEDVNVDEPPEGDEDACKAEIYAAHEQEGTSCKACHQLVDPIGFGLERYDQAGQYRTHDPGKPECVIEGQGELVGVGTFSGPAELADLMIESGLLNRCVVSQLYRFAVGRYELVEQDTNFVEAVMERTGDDDFEFEALLLEFVSSDMFRFRRREEG
jgi:hypothetical protein